MSRTLASAHLSHHLTHLHARFLALLPQIEIRGRIFFRYLKCPQSKADALQEMVALAWKWFLSLSQRGKDAADFVNAFTRFLAQAVQSGRCLVGINKPHDVFSPRARHCHQFSLGSLPQDSSLAGTVFEDALTDNTQTPVEEQVCFRLDFPAWLKTRTDRDRRMVQDLMRGERTLDVSRKYGVSPARISKLRRDFLEDWTWFCGEREVSGGAQNRHGRFPDAEEQ